MSHANEIVLENSLVNIVKFTHSHAPYAFDPREFVLKRYGMSGNKMDVESPHGMAELKFSQEGHGYSLTQSNPLEYLQRVRRATRLAEADAKRKAAEKVDDPF